jgi:hypothetical protein
MNDEKKAAIFAELVAFANAQPVEELPEGAATIDEMVAALRAEIPGIGYDRSVKLVHKMEAAGTIKMVRRGSRKYYYIP